MHNVPRNISAARAQGAANLPEGVYVWRKTDGREDAKAE